MLTLKIRLILGNLGIKSLLNDDRKARNWSFGADIKRKYYIKYCISETQFFRRSTENIGRLAKAQFPEWLLKDNITRQSNSAFELPKIRGPVWG